MQPQKKHGGSGIQLAVHMRPFFGLLPGSGVGYGGPIVMWTDPGLPGGGGGGRIDEVGEADCPDVCEGPV
jgi:hypothetical protein